MSKFTDIYKQELKSKGVLSSLASAAGKRIREKTDIRNILFGGKGIFSATGQKIFGKGYSATAAAQRSPLTSTTPSKTTDLLVQNLEAIAKNTSPISGMRKDIGYIRKDVNAILKILSSKAIGGAGGGGGVSNLVMLNMMKNLTKFLTSKAAIGTAIGAGTIGALSFGANKLRGMTNEELQKEENANVPSNRAEREGITKGQAAAKNVVEARAKTARTKAQANDAVKAMADQKLSGAAADDFLRSYFGPVNTPTLQQILEECDSNVKDLYLKKIAETKTKPITSAQTPAPSATPTPAATQDWRAAERASYGNAPSPAPSNAVTTAEGTPVMTGTGGFVTSGEPAPTAPSPIPSSKSAGTEVTGPSKFDYESYAKAVGARESGNNYKAVNTLGFVGKYQFGAPALTDIGLVKKGTKNKDLKEAKNWNIDGGLDTFLNTPKIQEDAMKKYTEMNMKTLKRIGVISDKSSAKDIAGALASAHLLGPGGAKNLIVKGKEGQDAYGTKASEYLRLGQASQSETGTSLASASQSTTTLKAQTASAGTALASASQESSTLRTQMAAAPAQPIVITQPSASAPQQKNMQQTQVASAFNENAVDLFLNNTLGLGA